MKKTATLGAALVLSAGVLAGGAAPASAQTIECGELTWTACALVFRQVQHVEEELGRVPGYVQDVRDIVLPIYDRVEGTVRCVISGDCPE